MPFLYEEILLYRSKKVFEKANLIAQKYGHYVRTIAVCTLYPEAVTRDFYDQNVTSLSYPQIVYHRKYLERGYQYLLRCFEKFDDSDDTGIERICHHLSEILHSTSSIQRFIFLGPFTPGSSLNNVQEICDIDDHQMTPEIGTIVWSPRCSAFWDCSSTFTSALRLLQVLARAPSPIRDLEANLVFKWNRLLSSEIEDHMAVSKHLVNAYFHLGCARGTQRWHADNTIVQAFRIAHKLESMT